MKNNTVQFILLVGVIIISIYVSAEIKAPFVSKHSSSAFYSTKNMDLDYNLCHKDDIAMVDPIKFKKAFTPELGKSLLAFKEAIGFKESQNDYFRVNQFGYLGKYQFGKSTLEMIGIQDPTIFLRTPELQEKAFYANTERNKWILRRDIKRFVGKRINGVNVTESGILAAAHLAGPGNVKKWLRSYGSVGFSDAFGTSVRTYMKRFSGFDTSSIEPKRRAKVILKA
jgi:hypothetical protein